MTEVYKFHYNNEPNLLSTMAEQLGAEMSDNKMKIPPHIGAGVLNEFEIEDGLHVIFGELILEKQLEYIKKASRTKKHLTIFFKHIERGKSILVPFEGEYQEVKSGGVHFYSSNVPNHIIFPDNSHTFIFRVFMTMEWAEANLNGFISQDKNFFQMVFGKDKIMHFEPLTNRFLRLFRDVFKSEFDQKLNHLIVKDKGYEAVVLFFDHFYKKFFHENINYSKYTIGDQKRLYGLIDYIKDNLNKELSLDHLTRKVGFSKSKLQSMFHHFFHQSIYAYIKSLRMEQAVELLKGTDDDIRMIAHHLGYNSSTHFINLFKKHYGLSPKKFRTQKLSQQS